MNKTKITPLQFHKEPVMQNNSKSMKKVVAFLVCSMLVFQLTGCGYIMHPERKGQSHDYKPMDTDIMLLDSALLILGILPGVVAFIVDFSTGCIYLPGEIPHSSLDNSDMQNFQVIKVDPAHMNQTAIEKVLQEHTGQMISLNSPEMLIFKSDTRNFDISQTLKDLQMGKDLALSGEWFSGSHVNFIDGEAERLAQVRE